MSESIGANGIIKAPTSMQGTIDGILADYEFNSVSGWDLNGEIVVAASSVRPGTMEEVDRRFQVAQEQGKPFAFYLCEEPVYTELGDVYIHVPSPYGPLRYKGNASEFGHLLVSMEEVRNVIDNVDSDYVTLVDHLQALTGQKVDEAFDAWFPCQHMNQHYDEGKDALVCDDCGEIL